jgi:hypothetical protein
MIAPFGWKESQEDRTMTDRTMIDCTMTDRTKMDFMTTPRVLLTHGAVGLVAAAAWIRSAAPLRAAETFEVVHTGKSDVAGFPGAPG